VNKMSWEDILKDLNPSSFLLPLKGQALTSTPTSKEGLAKVKAILSPVMREIEDIIEVTEEEELEGAEYMLTYHCVQAVMEFLQEYQETDALDKYKQEEL
tara:strand:+ start:652 stop:951 length:300 start_codon:yes stop_codon:yes gene_type:complete